MKNEQQFEVEVKEKFTTKIFIEWIEGEGGKLVTSSETRHGAYNEGDEVPDGMVVRESDHPQSLGDKYLASDNTELKYGGMNIQFNQTGTIDGGGFDLEKVDPNHPKDSLMGMRP